MQINGNLDFQGGSITHDGVPIDNTHTHTAQGANAITTPPNP
jgi:phage baseplate assembly protein gpV